MSGPQDLESRIRSLEDVEAIKRMKHKYFRCVDLQFWVQLRDCFVPEATTAYQDGRMSYQGLDAIIEFLKESLGVHVREGRRGMHMGHHPEIELKSETTATGIWALDDFSFHIGDRTGRRMAGHYHDRYVKVNGDWKIEHTGYRTAMYARWEGSSLDVTGPQGEGA